MPEYIPASKVYAEFGIPRNLLRELAERGVVRVSQRTFDNGANVINLYNRNDIAAWQNGGDNGNT